ncbi:MAG: MATE family efflux transporter [Oscillospiraceae bacterium]|nr:MATE family efflux transporter [Oscillospiraceae bacterium]
MKQNKMGTVQISTLMLKMGLPMIISMILQAFYNIVDSYFVSQMPNGETGVTALTLAFPIQMLMIAIGVGTGVGINALLSRSLGAGEREKASKIAGNAIFLGICTYVVFLLIGIFGIDAYLRSQTSDAAVLKMATEYLRICTIVSFGAILSMIYEKLLQGVGRTTLSTIAQLAGALTNIILDPIMIFGWLGCPEMGIAGAAWATVIGQIVTLVMSAYLHHAKNHDLDTALKYLKPQGATIAQIYKIGIPAIIMQALMSIMTYGANIILGGISDAAVTAYGVYYKLQQFIFFAAFGMNNALIPIIGFNYGMRDKARVKDGIKYGMIYTLIIMLLGTVAFQAFAPGIMAVFALSAETEKLAVTTIRVITVGYLFAGANIAFQGIFQAFGEGVKSLIVSALRLIVVALPLLWVLSRTASAAQSAWWAFPLAEAAAVVVAVVLYKKMWGRVGALLSSAC